jgi:hypothetical protein
MYVVLTQTCHTFCAHCIYSQELIDRIYVQAGDFIDKALEKAKDIAAESQLNKNKGD